MRSDRKKIIGAAFLAIPFLAMLLMIATNMRHLSHTEYRIAIEGYDPRDLLKGHYLIFRYKWPEGAVNKFDDHAYPRTPQVCACMSGAPGSPQVRFDACESIHPLQQACNGAVKVSGDAGGGGYQPAPDLRQFFIPEEQASRLEKMLRSGTHKFEVGIVPRGGGQAQLRELYVDGLPFDEYLRRFPEDLPAQ